MKGRSSVDGFSFRLRVDWQGSVYYVKVNCGVQYHSMDTVSALIPILAETIITHLNINQNIYCFENLREVVFPAIETVYFCSIDEIIKVDIDDAPNYSHN